MATTDSFICGISLEMVILNININKLYIYMECIRMFSEGGYVSLTVNGSQDDT